MNLSPLLFIHSPTHDATHLPTKSGLATTKVRGKQEGDKLGLTFTNLRASQQTASQIFPCTNGPRRNSFFAFPIAVSQPCTPVPCHIHSPSPPATWKEYYTVHHLQSEGSFQPAAPPAFCGSPVDVPETPAPGFNSPQGAKTWQKQSFCISSSVRKCIHLNTDLRGSGTWLLGTTEFPTQPEPAFPSYRGLCKSQTLPDPRPSWTQRCNNTPSPSSQLE